MLNGSKVKVSEQPICEDAVWVVVDPSIALGRITLLYRPKALAAWESD